MVRSTHSVVFASLLLMAQLLFGVMSAGASVGSPHCDDCPVGQAQAMTHDTGAGGHDCGTQCGMAGSGSCNSFSMNPPLLCSLTFYSVFDASSFGCNRLTVELPDAPVFDFLRPPARA